MTRGGRRGRPAVEPRRRRPRRKWEPRLADTDRAFLQRLAAEVTASRDDLDLSQAQAAEQAGVSENTVLNFERGRGSRNMETVLAICRVVGVPIGAGRSGLAGHRGLVGTTRP